jgi:integrase
MPGRKTQPPTRGNCVTPKAKAKSALVTQLVRLARKERLDYATFLYVCQQARRRLGLRKPPHDRALPHLLPEADLKKFFRVLQQCGNVQHEIMLKFLFFSAVRVSELVHVKVTDIDFAQCKIFIAQGKGRKERYICNRTPGARVTELKVAETSAARAKALGSCRLPPRRQLSNSPIRPVVVGVRWLRQ